MMGGKRRSFSRGFYASPNPRGFHGRKQAGCAQSAAEGKEMENWGLEAVLAATFPGGRGQQEGSSALQ